MKFGQKFAQILGIVSVGAMLVVIAVQSVGAEEAFQSPCQGKPWWAGASSTSTFEDFDFLVGEWFAVDRESGDLVGFDRIEKVLEGCSLQQHWQHLNDQYTLPNAPYRLTGESSTALGSGGIWRQVWLDNAGGNLPMEGGLDDTGTMDLESEWMEFVSREGQSFQLKYRLLWKPEADGTILTWGYQKQWVDDTPEPEEWQKYFDLVYHRNVPGGPTFRLQPPPEQNPAE